MSSKPRPIERKKTDLSPEGGGQVPQTNPGKSPQMFSADQSPDAEAIFISPALSGVVGL